ncbi:MAG: hypothetical protein M3044_03530, partial [Thermoproteota archaeon]|nr:hypothetical protein [Thermoproteota archaeon]
MEEKHVFNTAIPQFLFIFIQIQKMAQDASNSLTIRRAPTRHDSIDFRPLITKISELVPLSVVTADKGYDSEDNHV